MLHEILPRHTKIPVELITERLLVETNHVFIIPAQRDLHVLEWSHFGREIAAFFDPSTGSVTIDGVDIRQFSQFSLKTLRRQIATVLQPLLIFPISVRDNLAYRTA